MTNTFISYNPFIQPTVPDCQAAFKDAAFHVLTNIRVPDKQAEAFYDGYSTAYEHFIAWIDHPVHHDDLVAYYAFKTGKYLENNNLLHAVLPNASKEDDPGFVWQWGRSRFTADMLALMSIHGATIHSDEKGDQS